jgi:iron complex outermembrane receptor protein
LNKFYRHTDFSFIAQNSYYKAFTNNFEKKSERFHHAFFFKMNHEKKNFYTTLMLRFEGLNFENLMFLPSGSLRAKVSEKLILETQIGLNGRFPTMNDLFWQPGGNPNLKAERGFQAQQVFLWTVFRNKFEKFVLKAVYFDQIINNRIQWIPAFAGFWQPVNLKTVRSNGLEISVEGEKKFKKTRLFVQFQYALTKSRSIKSDLFDDNSLGKQLIYTPLHNFKGNFSFEKESYGARFDSQAYSRRFTDADNIYWLLPYFIADISCWKKFSYKKFSVTGIIQCKNIGNANYQSMAFYALPGRNWQFSLLAALKK